MFFYFSSGVRCADGWAEAAAPPASGLQRNAGSWTAAPRVRASLPVSTWSRLAIVAVVWAEEGQRRVKPSPLRCQTQPG